MQGSQSNYEELCKKLIDLYTDNYAKLYACVYRMTGNHQDAEDILQNSFIKAYQNLDKFKENSKLYTWVYRIVVNESYRYFKYFKKLPLIQITEELGVSESEFLNSLEFTPNLEDNLIVEEMREKCLQGFLKCLPRNQRVCFLFKNLLELENRDIAEILDISVDNVKVTLHRGRKKLQDMFEMRCNLIDP
jgi:RNA polymerase sigma-70 factor (ECF subfamily)